MSDVLPPRIRYPHIFRPLSVSGIYWRITFAVSIPLLAAAFRSGWHIVLLSFVAVFVGVLCELLLSMAPASVARRANPGDGRIVAMSLLAVALLPPGSTPATAALVAVFVVMALHLQGGIGAYWLHPSLLAVVILTMVVPEAPEASTVSATAEFIRGLSSSPLVRGLEEAVFAPIGVRVPSEAWAALLGLGVSDPVSTAATMALPLLVGALIILGERLVPVSIPIAYFAAIIVVGELLGGIAFDLVVTGNAMLVGLFVVADPGSRPRHPLAMILFGVVAGGASALFRFSDAVAIPAVVGYLVAGSLVPIADGLLERGTH